MARGPCLRARLALVTQETPEGLWVLVGLPVLPGQGVVCGSREG